MSAIAGGFGGVAWSCEVVDVDVGGVFGGVRRECGGVMASGCKNVEVVLYTQWISKALVVKVYK